jgi:hypothetical protein
VTSRLRAVNEDDDQGLLATLVGDRRALISASASCLVLAGGFAIFQSLTGQFLPHDVAWLGLSSSELCARGTCRIVDFMFHDRVAFGGTLIAVGSLYLWLAAVPLRAGQAWAWWVLLISALTGFGSFLAYLGYGYLDTWHGVATLALLPLFAAGLVISRRRLSWAEGPTSVLRSGRGTRWATLDGTGRALVVLAAAGTTVAGATILAIGTTTVFVAQDLVFMGRGIADLDEVSVRLVPLIAHDRAGFGGGLATTGLAALGVARCADRSRSVWQVLVVAGVAGFGAAIGVHVAVGYTDLTHLGPAILGAVTLAIGLALWRPIRPV